LRILALGARYEEVGGRIAKSFKRPFTGEDLRAVLVGAAVLTRETPLLAPTESAFLRRHLLPPAGAFEDEPGIELSVADLDDLRSLAGELIDSYLAAEDESSERPDPRHVAMQSAALQYAEAILHQQDVLDELGRARLDDTSVHAQLPTADHRRVEDFLLFTGGKTLDTWIDSWQGCVGWVEDDPEHIVFEPYEPRLRTRDGLATAVSLLTPTSRTFVESQLAPLDERFARATREVSTSIRPPSPWKPQPWWWYRVPSRLGEHFKSRLEYLAPAAAREALAEQRRHGSDPGETES
jgi:hypothetical protein